MKMMTQPKTISPVRAKTNLGWRQLIMLTLHSHACFRGNTITDNNQCDQDVQCFYVFGNKFLTKFAQYM